MNWCFSFVPQHRGREEISSLLRDGTGPWLARAMVLSRAELEALQLEAMADDVEIDLDRMSLWSSEQAMAYFESGGADIPPGPSTKSSESIDVVGTVDVSDGIAAMESSGSATVVAGVPPGVEKAKDQAAAAQAPGAALEEELRALSVKALKARCIAAGLQTDDCLSKADLVQRATEAPALLAAAAAAPTAPCAAPTAADPSADWFRDLPTKEVKRRLEHAGVNVSSCFERTDFEALARRHPCAAGASKAGTGGGERAADGRDFWVSYSAKELRRLLTERHVDTAGCLDKADLLAAAEKSRNVLLAPAPTVVKKATSALDARQAALQREKQEKIRAGLEQLGGVVHGGYQIDMFGTKRGRCLQNPRCFRYLPGNVKVNGCAMKGTAGAPMNVAHTAPRRPRSRPSGPRAAPHCLSAALTCAAMGAHGRHHVPALWVSKHRARRPREVGGGRPSPGGRAWRWLQIRQQH